MTDRGTGGITRRSVLSGAAGGAAALSLSAAGTAGAASTGTPDGPDMAGWLEGDPEANNYDGTVVDETGSDTVTVEVGAGENGLAFGPAAVRIDPGTTVQFEWTGDGGTHNVIAEAGPADLDSGQAVDTTGVQYEHVFEEEGVTTYYCGPHRTLGMKGAIVVGDIQVGGGEVRPDFGDWLADVDGGYEDARGQQEVTVEVGASGNGGNLAFSPAGLWVDPGTTVRWEWTGEGGTHNVVAQEGPADLDSGQAVDTTGVQYEHVFEEGGITNYVCIPHEPLGMVGAVAVGDDVPTETVGDDGGSDGGGDEDADSGFSLPGGDPGIALVLATLGITGAAVVAVLLSEYRGAIGGTSAAAADEEGVGWPTGEEAVEREIGHEEFDPIGTASLIALYFLIIVGMGAFVYFVEFLGNGPTVIG